jgi:hypothetical protein
VQSVNPEMPGGVLRSGQIKVSRDAPKRYSKQSECQLMAVGVLCCLLAEVAAVENDSLVLPPWRVGRWHETSMTMKAQKALRRAMFFR